jgi:Putative exporter of polyketide antibiotics
MASPLTARTGRLTGFILRLDRLRISLWLIGIVFFTLIVPPALSGMYGSQEERDVMVETMANPAMTAMLGPGDLDNYTVGAMTAHQMLLLTSLVVGLMAILLVARHTRADEEEGRIEPLLGSPVSRTRLLGAYTVLAMANGFVMLSLAAIGLWSAGNASMENGLDFGTIYGAAVAYYPAQLVLIGLAAFFVGFVPKLTALNWLYLFYSFVVLYMGGLLQVPDWTKRMTPFGYVPNAPVEEVTLLPLLVLGLIAAVLALAGFAGYRRRDIETS